METFQNVKATLEELEHSSFTRLKKRFVASDGIGDCINGAIQFFALDPGKQIVKDRMPIVCTVGINYTQERRPFTGELRPLLLSSPSGVVDNTRCSEATSYVIAAYNRNASVWTNRPGVDPPSPRKVYAAPNATARSGLLNFRSTELEGRFILIMTNVSPFITQEKWQDQVKRTPSACENIVGDLSHLHSLYGLLGSAIDLWIGHSSIHGTEWVWPHFDRFVQHHKIEEWMLAGNINPQARLQFNLQYLEATHRLFDWFEPEPADDV